MQDINIVLGAPGCGKTTYLLSRLEYILKTTDPDKVAFVSFTRKGSYEGRDRAISRYNYKEEDFPYFRTIHSLAFRELGLSRYDVISKKNYKEFSTAMGMNFVGYYTEDLVNNDDKYLFYESLKKNNKESAELMLETLDYSITKRIALNYPEYKKYVGIVDFDDMLLNFIKANNPIPVDIAIIDEAQDLTTLQWEFCKVAFRDCKKIIIAGDDDQAIYEWSGADIKQFLSLTNIANNIHILDQSFRLKENILNHSKKLTNKIKNRVDKIFKPIEKGGNIIYIDSIEELQINNEQSYYFLSRNNYFLKDIKYYINKLGVTYWYKSKYSINMNIAKAIARYEEYRKTNNISRLNNDLILKEYLRPDFKLSNEWYRSFNLNNDDILYYRDLFKNKTDPNKCNIVINTIHGVKGGEADNIILLMDITKNVNSALYKNMDAELRCLYVGMTRAKSNLYIVNSHSKYGYDNINI